MSSNELPFEIYKWLNGLQVLPSTLRYKPSGSFQLDPKTNEELLSGVLIAKIISTLASLQSKPLPETISAMKSANTPAARVLNWNILSEILPKMGVTLQKTAQKEITSGDFQAVLKLLVELSKKVAKVAKLPLKEEDTLNIQRLNSLQQYSQAQSMLQFGVMLVSKHFTLAPKQAIALLSDGSKYYAHMIVKGIKNSFDQIIAMLQTFTQLLPLHLLKSTESIQFALTLIKPTLISREEMVARRGCELFRDLIIGTKRDSEVVLETLKKEDIGFQFMYMGIKRHPALVDCFTECIYALGDHCFRQVFELYLRKVIVNEQEYVRTIIIMVEGVIAHPQAKKLLLESQLLHTWLKNCDDSFSSKKSKAQQAINQETKLLYLELLCNLWKAYSTQLTQWQAGELLLKGVEELKKNTRQNIYTVRIPALVRLFDLLCFLADGKNKLAGIIYKKIIFLFVEHHEDQQIREVILENLAVALQAYPTIPLDILLDPFMRQLESTEGLSYILNIFDFQFVLQISRHPTLTAESACRFLQFFMKLYSKNILYSALALRVILLLLSRFCEEEMIFQLLARSVTNIISIYAMQTFAKTKKSREDAVIAKQKRAQSIQLFKHIIKLEHTQLNAFMKRKLVEVYEGWLLEKRHDDSGLRHLLLMFGDVDEVCQEVQAEMEAERQAERHTPSSQAPETPPIPFLAEEDYLKQNSLGYKKGKLKGIRESVQGVYHPMTHSLAHSPTQLYNATPSKVPARVLEDIQRVKDNRMEHRRKAQQYIDSQRESDRKLSGAYSKLPDKISSTPLPFDSVKSPKDALDFMRQDEREDRDTLSTGVVLKMYSKEVKSLFTRYAVGKKDLEGQGLMSFPQVMKLLSEKGVASFIPKVVVNEIILALNHSKRKQKNVLAGVQEEAFPQFLTALAAMHQQLAFGADEPLGLRLQVLLKDLLKGENFYRPRQTWRGEVPEGYRKAKQIKVEMVYRTVSGAGVPEIYADCFQIVDWLLEKALGIHVLTGSTTTQTRHILIRALKMNRIVTNQDRLDKKDLTNLTLAQEGLRKEKVNVAESAFDFKKANHQNASQRIVKSKQKQREDAAQKANQQKRQEHAAKLKQELMRMREEKSLKETAEMNRKIQIEAALKKKEEDRKKYLEQNRLKLKEAKEIKQKGEKQKEQAEKEEKERLKLEAKKNEALLLEKQKDQIKQKIEKVNEKKKEIQIDRIKREKKEKIAKDAGVREDDKSEQMKQGMREEAMKEALQKYDTKLKDLFGGYFDWEKESIELHSMAIMLKDFSVVPQMVSPKILTETFKALGKSLDFAGFKDCLIRCVCRLGAAKDRNAEKTVEKQHSKAQSDGSKQSVQQIAQELVTLLKMNQPQYKLVIRAQKEGRK